MAPKHTKSPVNDAGESPHGMIHLEMKLIVIEDYKSGKSVMAIASHSGMSYSSIAALRDLEEQEQSNRDC